MSQDHVHKHGRTWRYSRGLVITLIAIAAVLLVARIAAPHALQWYVNKKLDESPHYDGHIGDVDLTLLRGAYRIQDVEIVKTDADVPVPLFAAKQVEFSLLWSALIHGTVVGKAIFYEPQINIVDSKDESKKQTGADEHWLTLIDDLFPLKIDEAIIRDGQIHFRNYESKFITDIYLSEVEASAQNMSNRQALSDSNIARVQVSARAMSVSDLAIDAAFDPTTQKPTFDINLRLLGLPILTLDNFIRTYAPFDIEAGTLDLVSEMAVRDGQLDGYVKPIIYDLDVFDWKEDIIKDKDNPLRALWEGFVGLVAKLLQNQPNHELATVIPLKGDITAPRTGVLAAIGNILKNAFVEAYRPNLEKTVSLFVDDNKEPTALPPPLIKGARLDMSARSTPASKKSTKDKLDKDKANKQPAPPPARESSAK